MGGSYNHVVTDQGNLASPERVNDMLENGGDVFEAIEEMYGMIWFLASLRPQTDLSPKPEELVEQARQNYKEGLQLARETPNKGKHHGS